MSNSKVRNLLMAMCVIGTNEYDFDYIDDPEVSDCLVYMYLYMMCDESVDKDRQEDLFQKFDVRYRNLSHDQQSIVEQEYKDIIARQDEDMGSVRKKTAKK